MVHGFRRHISAEIVEELHEGLEVNRPQTSHGVPSPSRLEPQPLTAIHHTETSQRRAAIIALRDVVGEVSVRRVEKYVQKPDWAFTARETGCIDQGDHGGEHWS